MRRLLATASALMAVLLVALPGVAGAYAAPGVSADLQVTASQVSGHVGDIVEVRLVVRNNGPNAVLPETWTLTMQAPAGTRIAGGSALAGSCEQGERQARCRYGFALRRGDHHELRLNLRIQAQPSSCGRAEVSYGLDPKARNNAANIRVTVDGQPSSCAVRTSPTPSATAGSPEPSQTPADEVTDVPPDEAPASAQVLPAYQSDDGGPAFGSILVIGGGLILVALGGVLIWRLLRRENEEGEDFDDETGPIYS